MLWRQILCHLCLAANSCMPESRCPYTLDWRSGLLYVAKHDSLKFAHHFDHTYCKFCRWQHQGVLDLARRPSLPCLAAGAQRDHWHRQRGGAKLHLTESNCRMSMMCHRLRHTLHCPCPVAKNRYMTLYSAKPGGKSQNQSNKLMCLNKRRICSSMARWKCIQLELWTSKRQIWAHFLTLGHFSARIH